MQNNYPIQHPQPLFLALESTCHISPGTSFACTHESTTFVMSTPSRPSIRTSASCRVFGRNNKTITITRSFFVFADLFGGSIAYDSTNSFSEIDRHDCMLSSDR